MQQLLHLTGGSHGVAPEAKVLKGKLLLQLDTFMTGT